MVRVGLIALLALAGFGANAEAQERRLKLLFLGDDGHHRPAERFRQIVPVFEARGIDLTYVDKTDALTPKILGGYDGLVIYANLVKVSPEQEAALLDFVESGKGLIPVHCASYCFLNSPKYIALVGAQFQKHGTGTFRTKIVDPAHPILAGYRGFESWDETYVHTKHNAENRTVLEVREEGGKAEPWTWTRTQGRGRVFYTAWGHDERTWGNPGFHNLLERGVRWAVGDDPRKVPAFVDRPGMTAKRTDAKPFEYMDAKVPFYPGGKGKGRDPLSQMQKPLDPAESAKHFVTPVGFAPKLFVSEPLVRRPICMNWDERGRLWIAESVDYPNEIKPAGEGRDRIVICEDTNGDGVADKVSVFADKLSIPTSFTFARGGVIVAQAPHMLFLKDTDGDGVADQRTILFSGWHTGDTHAGPSNLHYGFDNWIYGIVGYSGFDGVVGGERHSFRTGFFRFRPDGSKLEFLRNTSNNSWGVGFTEDGALFGSTANGNPSVHLPIPNRYYESVRGLSSGVLPMISESAKMDPITEKVRQVDHHGNFTAAAGHAIYTARTYPREYWNRTAFVTEPTGHLVATFQIFPNGSGYRTRNSWNLLASDDEWSAPIAAEVGPDGNVWVIDWYNYIVQHNPTPAGFKTGKGNAYETPLRDKTHGRIYRVVHEAGKSMPPPTLAGADGPALVAALGHDNLFWRKHAQRLLVERGKTDVVPLLLAKVKDHAVDAIGLNVGAIHAIWALEGLGAFDATLAFRECEANDVVRSAAIAHPSAGVRRNAVMALPRIERNFDVFVRRFGAAEPDLTVRLEALLATSKTDASFSPCDDLVRAADEAGADKALADATFIAAAHHSVSYFVTALQSKALSPAALALLERVAELVARQERDPTAVFAGLEWTGKCPPETSTRVLAGLARGWPEGRSFGTKSDLAEKAFADAFKKVAPADRGALLSLAQKAGIKSLASQIAEIAAGFLGELRNEKASDAARAKAAQQYVDLRKFDATAAKDVLALLSPRLAPELAEGLVAAAGRSEAVAVGSELAKLTPTLTPATRAHALRVLLGRPEWTRALLDAVDAGLSASDLSLDQKQALLAHPTKQVAALAKKVLAKSGGIPSADRQKVVDELTVATQTKGDAKAGRLAFKTHCAKCHTHSGEGAKIGPDLTGMAVHPKTHLLIEVLDPNRSVEGNYRQWIVTTKAGRVLQGLLASESKTAIELVDTEGKKHAVGREEIDELTVTPKSLMPEGFEKQFKGTELVDLLEFLTQRGKFLPLALDRVATAVSTKGMFYSETADVERLVFPDWNPKTFEGVPFRFVDPEGAQKPNVILFYGPNGYLAPRMPKQVELPINAPAKAIHVLGGVSGWGYPYGGSKAVVLTARLHYADGKTEDHLLRNGEHFADYIRRVDVPGSKFAFAARGQQVRYLAIRPERAEPIAKLEFVRGPDASAPIVMAITVESRE